MLLFNIARLPLENRKGECNYGEHLANLKSELDDAVGLKGVQLVTLSRTTAYMEYAPYHFVDSEQEFKEKVLALRAQ